MTPERIAELEREYTGKCSPHRHHCTRGDWAWMTLDILELLDAVKTAQAQIADLKRGGVVVPEAYRGEREHVAFLGALKYEIENPTPSQTPTSFDVNRDYFEHYANAFSKDSERLAHGVGFMNGAAWHRERHSIPADRVLGEALADLENAVRFLAKQESSLFEIRGKAIRLLAQGEIEAAKDLITMKWPIIQGLRNQLDIAEVGKQACDIKRVRPAIDHMLRAQPTQEPTP